MGGGGAIGKVAFKLEKILITLGIIGIIAAITIPNIMGAYRKKVVETKLKKAFSELSQLLLLSEAENGNSYYWTWPSSHMTNQQNSIEGKAFIKTYFEPYLNKVMKEDGFKKKIYTVDGNEHYSEEYLKYNQGYYLPSGVVVYFSPSYTSAPTVAVMMPSGDSKLILGKNVFIFNFQKDKDKKRVVISARSYANWTCADLEKRRDYFRQSCIHEQDASGISSGNWCTFMIYCNNWEIPDDYPIKF